jgi:hypothetical protein
MGLTEAFRSNAGESHKSASLSADTNNIVRARTARIEWNVGPARLENAQGTNR